VSKGTDAAAFEQEPRKCRDLKRGNHQPVERGKEKGEVPSPFKDVDRTERNREKDWRMRA